MQQAIVTKFIGPTSKRGSRVKATAEAGSITVIWNHHFNVENNHRAAAGELAEKLGWSGKWLGGALPGAGYCFVLETDDVRNSIIVPKTKEG